MPILFFFLLLCTPMMQAQSPFQVWKPDYETLEKRSEVNCPEGLREQQRALYTRIEQYEYKAVLDFCDSLEQASNKNNCPLLAQIRAAALHKGGDWKACIQVLDSALYRLGPDPETIYRRAFLYAQMGDKGLYNARGWYLSKGFSDTLDNALFTQECYRSALHDLNYLVQHFQMSADDAYMMAYLSRQLKDYGSSISYARQLLRHPNLKAQARDLLIDNYLDLNQYAEAEALLLLAIEEYPRESSLYTRLYRAYWGQNDSLQAQQALRSFYFLQWVPEYLDLEETLANFKHLQLLNTDTTAQVKQKYWKKEIQKLPAEEQSRLAVCLLHSGAVQGEDLQERLLQTLREQPEAAQAPLIGLWYSDTPLGTRRLIAPLLQAQYPATAWGLFSNYLLKMESIPFNQVPPPIPQMLLELRPEEGLQLLLQQFKNNSAHRYLYLEAFQQVEPTLLRHALAQSDWPEQAAEQLLKDLTAQD